MTRHIARFGNYDDLLIVVERIVSIEGLMETRGGHPVAGADGLPKFTSSMISLENGHSLQVPHSPEEVSRRIMEAST